MFKSKMMTFLSIVMLSLAIGAFLYSNAYAQSTDDCEVCAGQQSPEENQECYVVDIGGFNDCMDWDSGVCVNWGECSGE